MKGIRIVSSFLYGLTNFSGLYVAKKMAHGMGGKVWADSEGEGKGSSFHLEFPELPGAPKPV